MNSSAAGFGIVITIMLLTAGLIVWTTAAAASGRLRRNGFAGIRIPSTQRSDAAWQAGHAAALRPTKKLALAIIVSCAVLLVVALAGYADSLSWLALTPAVLMLAGLVPIVRAASRGASQAD